MVGVKPSTKKNCAPAWSGPCKNVRFPAMPSIRCCVIISALRGTSEREVPARHLGEWVMRALQRIDQVAYVRFASVYRRFEDMQDFRAEIDKLERSHPTLEEGSCGYWMKSREKETWHLKTPD